jgi:hypothetical protein
MSTMNAGHPKASPRALFAAIASFVLSLFVAALALLSAAAAPTAERTIVTPLPGVEALRVD